MVNLFYPNIPPDVIEEIEDTLHSKWIGQGPKVDHFEQLFKERFLNKNYNCVAVSSGTAALHLAYILAGIQEGDEVISPVFTCTATNIPLLYLGAKIRFADIDPNTMNINIAHVKKLISNKTKAIVCMHFGGLPCDLDELHEIAAEYNIPVIEDAAQALGAQYKGKYIGNQSDFTAFSFQAIKHITTGDGGMLVIKDSQKLQAARELRWFGIDRHAKLQDRWKHDISVIGYKYQMNDISAAIGIASMQHFEETLAYRKKIYLEYSNRLSNIPKIKILSDNKPYKNHSAWTFAISVQNRQRLIDKLKEHNIESSPVHYRNDRYTIFSEQKMALTHMDSMENNYLLLPLHNHLALSDVKYICDTIAKYI